MARSIAELYSSQRRIIVTHGNGPQVGEELERSELAMKRIPKMPLYYLTAETQAVIGSEIETSLVRELARMGKRTDVSTVISHVVVNPKDKDFKNPTKPIGPFLSKEQLDEEMGSGKFLYIDTPSGYRRVVASPKPHRIVEFDAINNLSKMGIVIACGGGGIPVIDEDNRYKGVNAVIDKDLTTALLASSIKADKMVILTDADQLYMDYKRKRGAVKWIHVPEIQIILDSFEEGTIRPKIEACIEYLSAGGKEAYIGNVYELREIIRGKAGTKILR